MRVKRGMLVLSLIASAGVLVAACASSDSTGSRGNGAGAGDPTVASTSDAQSSSSDLAAQASADVIDVSSGSQVSLALLGGMGPIVSGQTISKASVEISDLELVDANGGSVVLQSAPFTGDLVALQDQLGPIFSQHSIQAGHYSALRFRLRSAWIESQDTQGADAVYATQGADTSQFPQGASVQSLQLSGLDPNGYVTCALPPGGIAVNGTSSLALQFALAQSLQVQSSGAWVLSPRCWLVDQGSFSSLDVDFQMASSVTSYSQYWSSGFQVMLLDSNLFPVCQVPLAVFQSAIFRAHFLYLQSFLGPFVAALVPPSGFVLQSTVAFSVDVQQSAVCSASIDVTSFQVSSGSFAIGTDNQSRVIQRDHHGHVLAQTSEPIGAVEDVAPTMHHREPVGPGEQQPSPAQPPQLPGNPPPRMRHEHGMMPPPEPTGTSPGHEHGMMPPPEPTSTSPGHEHGMTPPPAPTSTSPGHEHGMAPTPPPATTGTEMPPPAPTSTSHGHEHGMTPPPTPPATTGTEMPPPAPTSTSTGRGRGRGMTPPAPTAAPPATTRTPAPPTTANTAPPAPTGAPTTPPTPAPATTSAPPSPPSGGRGPRGGGGSTPQPSGGSGAPSGGPPSSGGHGSVGGPPATSGPPPEGDGGGRRGSR